MLNSHFIRSFSLLTTVYYQSFAWPCQLICNLPGIQQLFFSCFFSESHIHDLTYVGHMQYLYEMTMLSIKSVQYRPNRVMRCYADGVGVRLSFIMYHISDLRQLVSMISLSKPLLSHNKQIRTQLWPVHKQPCLRLVEQGNRFLIFVLFYTIDASWLIMKSLVYLHTHSARSENQPNI